MGNFTHLVFIIYALWSITSFHLWVLYILEIDIPNLKILKVAELWIIKKNFPRHLKKFILNKCHIHNTKILLNIFKKERTFKEKQESWIYIAILVL